MNIKVYMYSIHFSIENKVTGRQVHTGTATVVACSPNHAMLLLRVKVREELKFLSLHTKGRFLRLDRIANIPTKPACYVTTLNPALEDIHL